jgi:hypothetical protein
MIMILSTGNNGELTATSLNQLATWMLEHPCIDSDIMEVELPMEEPSGPEQSIGGSTGGLYLFDVELGSAVSRRGSGPRRRACSDIRSYLAERAGKSDYSLFLTLNLLYF